MRGEQLVVGLGGEDRAVRAGELPADQQGLKAADDEEQHRGNRVHDADLLVINGEIQLLHPVVADGRRNMPTASRGVVRGAAGSSRSRDGCSMIAIAVLPLNVEVGRTSGQAQPARDADRITPTAAERKLCPRRTHASWPTSHRCGRRYWLYAGHARLSRLRTTRSSATPAGRRQCPPPSGLLTGRSLLGEHQEVDLEPDWSL